jgi:hypothetical protein
MPYTRLASALFLLAPALAGAKADARAALVAAFGGEALQRVSRFDYRLQLHAAGGELLRDADHRLLPASGQLWQRNRRDGSEQWWDGSAGWQRDAEGRWLSLDEAASAGLAGHVHSHFFVLLQDPATRVERLDGQRLRLIPATGEAFTIVLDEHGRIAENRFDDGTVATESDYVALDGAWWPQRFAVTTAAGRQLNGVFSAMALGGEAVLPAPAPPPSDQDGEAVSGAALRLAPGTLSTPRNEYNLSEAATLRVFARSDAGFANSRIWRQRRVGGGWSAPEQAPLSPGFADSDPWLTPDGRWLYFVSNRPAAGRAADRRDLDLWRLAVDAGGGFGEPEHLGAAVNSPGYEFGPELHDGVLYFNSTRAGGPAALALYRAALGDDGLPGGAEALPAPFNDGAQQGDFTLSPDGRYALFWSQRAGSAAGDLYAVRRHGEGWDSTAIRLPSPFTSAGFDFTPSFSADGRLLRFASDRAPAGLSETGPGAGGLADLYAVPVADLDAALPRD